MKNKIDVINSIKKFKLAAPILILASIVSFVYFYPFFSTEPKMLADLTQNDWAACLGNHDSKKECETFPVILPSDIGKLKSGDFVDRVAYFSKFETPKTCLSSLCSIFVSEIGDSAEFWLNGSLLSVHGGSSAYNGYAKHYPVKVDIPPSMLKRDSENELSIKVRSFKKVQAGIRKGPFGIYAAEDAFALKRMQITKNIILPLISAIVLFLISLGLSVFSLVRFDQDLRLKKLIQFSVSGSFFLLSFTELPREILPISIAGYLHYFSRLFFDYSFFELVRTLFYPTSRQLQKLRYSYFIFLAMYPLVYIAQSLLNGADGVGFDMAYVITRFALPLLLMPHILAIYGAFVMEKNMTGLLMSAVFFITFCFQVNDSLVFHSVMPGSYFIKGYPVLIALVLVTYVIRSKISKIFSDSIEQIKSNTIRRVVHDLKNPLTSMRWLLEKNDLQTEERELLLRSVMDMESVIGEVLPGFSRNASCFEPLSILGQLPGSFDHLLRAKEVKLKIEDFSNALTLHCKGDASLLKRVIGNLVKNAIEASPRNAFVTLRLRIESKTALIEILDQGPGIPKEVISAISTGGKTLGKVGGNGIGLSSAYEILNECGSFSIETSSKGTKLILGLKIEKIELKIKNQPIDFSNDIILIDDDSLMRDVWAFRANQVGLKLKVFDNPDEFVSVMSDLPKSTPLYIDYQLSSNQTGNQLAQNAVDCGFTNVFIQTGYDSSMITSIPGVKITGKQPPF